MFRPYFVRASAVQGASARTAVINYIYAQHDDLFAARGDRRGLARRSRKLAAREIDKAGVDQRCKPLDRPRRGEMARLARYRRRGTRRFAEVSRSARRLRIRR